MSGIARILLVDDEEDVLRTCELVIGQLNRTEVVIERGGRAASERLAHEPFDMLITDIMMPDLSGVELIRIARKHQPELTALVITGFPALESAIECMRLGAADYIMKPLEIEKFLQTVNRLLEERRLRRENRLLSRRVERPYAFEDMVGDSAAITAVKRDVEKLAAVDVDVLVTGETGVGKELVARTIHRASARRNGKFVPVDCGAVPDQLMESELFGHERGSFTGADSTSIGLFEFADGGTLFLDEIGELTLPLQAKLLRAVQERRIRRVGGTQEITVDVRIVAATNRDLGALLAQRRFREDLYYRIHVARIHVPPLRERPEDVPVLMTRFLERFALEMGRRAPVVDSMAAEVLRAYPWPGNVRELMNVARRCLAMTEGETLTVDDLPDPIPSMAGERTASGRRGFFQLKEERIEAFEREYLHRLMVDHRGDVPRAAQEASIPRGTLYRLLKKHSLRPEQFRAMRAGEEEQA